MKCIAKLYVRVYLKPLLNDFTLAEACFLYKTKGRCDYIVHSSTYISCIMWGY
jgi:hypothetical protein